MQAMTVKEFEELGPLLFPTRSVMASRIAEALRDRERLRVAWMKLNRGSTVKAAVKDFEGPEGFAGDRTFEAGIKCGLEWAWSLFVQPGDLP